MGESYIKVDSGLNEFLEMSSTLDEVLDALEHCMVLCDAAGVDERAWLPNELEKAHDHIKDIQEGINDQIVDDLKDKFTELSKEEKQ